MQDSQETALRISASGLQAQSTRLRVVSENIADAQSTGSTISTFPATPRSQRAYEMNSKVIQAAHQMSGTISNLRG